MPGKPTPAPATVASVTSTSAISVTFPNVNTDVGGTDVTLYELEMDDGLSGEFSVVFTSAHETTYLVTDGIVRGRYYRFRYRV